MYCYSACVCILLRVDGGYNNMQYLCLKAPVKITDSTFFSLTFVTDHFSGRGGAFRLVVCLQL